MVACAQVTRGSHRGGRPQRCGGSRQGWWPFCLWRRARSPRRPRLTLPGRPPARRRRVRSGRAAVSTPPWNRRCVGQWSDLPTGCGLVRARRAGPGRRVRVAAMAPSLTPMRSPFGTDGGGHGAQPRPKVRQRRGRGSGQCNVTLGLGKGHPRMSRWHTCARRCSTVVAVPTCCGGML